MIRRHIVLFVALQGCATYAGSGVASDYAKARADPGWTLIEGLPEVRQQNDWDCGVAAINSVIDFWRVAPSAPIFERVLGDIDAHPRPIKAGELRDVVRAHGLNAFLIAGGIDDLVQQIRKGRPMIVGLLKPTLGGANAHYEIVIGIHEERRLVLSFDPSLGYRENDIDAFEQEWQATGSVLLVVVARHRPKHSRYIPVKTGAVYCALDHT